jgi:hypothetical protein
VTDTLDTQIRILVTELMDSAPQAPSITDIELLQARRSIDIEGPSSIDLVHDGNANILGAALCWRAVDVYSRLVAGPGVGAG